MGIIRINPIIIHPFCSTMEVANRNCFDCPFPRVEECNSPCSMCIRGYPNHKRGCPNYNKKKDCPPNAQLFDSVFNISKPIYAIYNVFNFKRHVERMRDKHPDWSKRQLECCLYWQPTARKELKKKIGLFQGAMLGITSREHIVTDKPEAMGVNVTGTMRKVGIELEWPPVNIALQIAFGGERV